MGGLVHHGPRAVIVATISGASGCANTVSPRCLERAASAWCEPLGDIVKHSRTTQEAAA